MITARIAASVSVMLLAVVNTGFGREWKDASGEHSRTGEFVACRDGRVIVRLPDGKEASATLERFCAADQAYVRDLVEGKAKRGAIPAKLAAQTVQARTSDNASSSPPVTSLAQTAPPEDLAAPAASSSAPDERTGGTSHEKYVFYADCARFHIIRHETGIQPITPGSHPIIGTAHYAFRYPWPPCCCCCCCPCYGPWYLSFLKERMLSTNNVLYAYDIGTSDVIEWSFDLDPGSGHRIEYRTKTGWHFYGYSTLKRPK